MDSRLDERLIAIADQVDVLKDVEAVFLELEAHRKVLFAQLYLKTAGTVAERESTVYASADWINFITGLVSAESELNHARRIYELKLKAYDGEHLSLKTETPAIRRQA